MGLIKVVKKSDYDKIKIYWAAYKDHIKYPLSDQEDRRELCHLFDGGENLLHVSDLENGIPLYARVPDNSYIILEYGTNKPVTFCPDNQLSKWCTYNNVREHDIRSPIGFHKVITNITIEQHSAFYYLDNDYNVDLDDFIRNCACKDRFMLVREYGSDNSLFLCRKYNNERNVDYKNLTMVEPCSYFIDDGGELIVHNKSDFYEHWNKVREY
jgi:hypothetical protein